MFIFFLVVWKLPTEYSLIQNTDRWNEKQLLRSAIQKPVYLNSFMTEAVIV